MGQSLHRSPRKYNFLHSAAFATSRESGVIAVPDWIKNGCPLDGLDPFRSGYEHYEPVKAQRGSTCIRHMVEGCKDILIDGIGEAENALLFSLA